MLLPKANIQTKLVEKGNAAGLPVVYAPFHTRYRSRARFKYNEVGSKPSIMYFPCLR